MIVLMPYPKIHRGKNKGQLVSMNNWYQLHHTIRTEIKNSVKTYLATRLKGRVKYDSLKLTFQLYRPTKRKFDSINLAPVVKVVEDTLILLGFAKDDKDDIIILLNTIKVDVRVDTLKIVIKGK